MATKVSCVGFILWKWLLIASFPLPDEDSENEKENQKALEETYKPLVDWLTKQVKHVVSDGSLSRFTRRCYF